MTLTGFRTKKLPNGFTQLTLVSGMTPTSFDLKPEQVQLLISRLTEHVPNVGPMTITEIHPDGKREIVASGPHFGSVLVLEPFLRERFASRLKKARDK